MNEKERIIEEVLEIVIDECEYSFRPIIKDEIVGKRGDVVLQMTRCIFVTELIFLNYSKPIIAAYLGRTEQAIDDILSAAHEYRCIKKDWTYLVSEANSTRRCAALKKRTD